MNYMNYINFTTPIYYTNGTPHIGHTYTTILADVYKKYYSLLGYNARLCTGTDEHGLKVQKTALQQGLTPQQLVDKLSDAFKKYWDEMGIAYDDFIRTTEQRHERVAQWFWSALQAKGDIYLDKYSGLYCVACEQYYKEAELVEGNLCPIHSARCEHFTESSYFFRLSKYQDKLIEYIRENPSFIQPSNRRSEILGFLENEPLQDISISRNSFDWGIRVPTDNQHVMYVWFDALINYISSLGGVDSEDYRNYWTNTYHFIGKDILRFHSVYWIAMLMALDLPLPKAVVAHGWWKSADKKISKSARTEMPTPTEICAAATTDGLRFYLTNELSLERDGNFDYDNLVQNVNSNLSNNLGNLFNRVIVLSNKFFGGVIEFPAVATDSDWDKRIAAAAQHTKETYLRSMASFRHFEAITEVMKFSDLLNTYIHETEPWKLIKDTKNTDDVKKILANIAEGLRWIMNMGYPFFPDLAHKMNNNLYQQPQFALPSAFENNQKLTIKCTDILFKRIETPTL
jgi:methionyl-tRNA synthetase